MKRHIYEPYINLISLIRLTFNYVKPQIKRFNFELTFQHKNIELLIKSRADVSVTDFNKETALTHALKSNSHKCIGIIDLHRTACATVYFLDV